MKHHTQQNYCIDLGKLPLEIDGRGEGEADAKIGEQLTKTQKEKRPEAETLDPTVLP
jgi:hypothetical protein